MENRNIDLALGSGGARGMAHLGVIEELEKGSYEIRSLSGCSIGALVAGAYACGKITILKEWITSLNEKDLFGLFDFTYAKNGLIKGEKIMEKLASFGMDVNIEDLPIPYVAVAVDLVSKQEVAFTSGPLLSAIRASIAIPTLFTPLNVGEMQLVDGGVTNPLPISHIKRTPNSHLVAVSLNGGFPYEPPASIPTNENDLNDDHAYRLILMHFVKEWIGKMPNKRPLHKKDGMLELLDQCFDLMQDEITTLTIQKFKPDLIVEISRQAAQTFAFHRANELIEAGRDAYLKAFDTLNRSKESESLWRRLGNRLRK